MKIKGRIIDIHKRITFNGEILVEGGFISEIREIEEECRQFIIPGLIDSHVHIESSMLTPGAFAAAAVVKGTVGVVTDPHEIANVMGVEGIEFMISDSRRVPVKFFFGVPSCVPATSLESNGATIGLKETQQLMKEGGVTHLAEMMNFPGVLAGDSLVMDKIAVALDAGKPVDGHAPGISGSDLRKYIGAGISTDHEASSLDEGREKIEAGMKILIREGSAARNLEALHPLLAEYPDKVMLCCDDIHPEMLVERHIDGIVRSLLSMGHDLYDVLRAASLNPVQHYGLDVGLLRVGDRADFVVIDNPRDMKILSTWIDGMAVYEEGRVAFGVPAVHSFNYFNSSTIEPRDIRINKGGDRMRVIGASDGELNTSELIYECGDQEVVNSDISRDILKIVVKERYHDKPPVAAFINGFGIREGAFASSVAHDSHNIIAVGVDDESICQAINRVVEMQGGLAVCREGKVDSLSLEIGGIMSDVPCGTIAQTYEELTYLVKDMGCDLKSPFMTLSFMSLLVIPELKLGDRGLFSVGAFDFVDLFV